MKGRACGVRVSRAPRFPAGGRPLRGEWAGFFPICTAAAEFDIMPAQNPGSQIVPVAERVCMCGAAQTQPRVFTRPERLTSGAP